LKLWPVYFVSDAEST